VPVLQTPFSSANFGGDRSHLLFPHDFLWARSVIFLGWLAIASIPISWPRGAELEELNWESNCKRGVPFFVLLLNKVLRWTAVVWPDRGNSSASVVLLIGDCENWVTLSHAPAAAIFQRRLYFLVGTHSFSYNRSSPPRLSELLKNVLLRGERFLLGGYFNSCPQETNVETILGNVVIALYVLISVGVILGSKISRKEIETPATLPAIVRALLDSSARFPFGDGSTGFAAFSRSI